LTKTATKEVGNKAEDFQIIWVKRTFFSAVLKIDGKVSDNKEELMMFVRVGSRLSRN